MRIELKNDPARGVTVASPSVYYSLGSPHWINMTRGPFAPYPYHYSKPGEGWKDGEMATMNLANWGGKGTWYTRRSMVGRKPRIWRQHCREYPRRAL
jgi:hypothetical protein